MKRIKGSKNGHQERPLSAIKAKHMIDGHFLVMI
ncbi:Uncharacterised protein [Legionella israelensis]|nr:Uncharacterised protein [Legionella israelensis]